MKLKTTPIEVMKALIAAHLKKRTEDDETATMLAIKPMMIESFGAKPAELLLQNRAFKDYFYSLRAAQAGRLKPRPQPNSPKMEIV